MANKKNKPKKEIKFLSPKKYFKTKARNLPIYNCWVNEDWQQQMICNVIVARQHAGGTISFAIYLVDLGCQGIKDTSYQFNLPLDEFEFLLEKLENQNFEVIDYKLAHNLIFTAYDYANELGIESHKDFESTTLHFLEKDDDSIPLMDIEVGQDDKPIYIIGEFDKPAYKNRIINSLENSVGNGNFIVIDPNYTEPTFETEDEIVEIAHFLEKKYEHSNTKEKAENYLNLLKKDRQSEVDKLELKYLTVNLLDEISDENKLQAYLEEIDSYWDLNWEFYDDKEIEELKKLDYTEKDSEKYLSSVRNGKNSLKDLPILRGFQERYGDNVFIRMAILNILEEKNTKEFKSYLKDSIKKHPSSMVFKIIDLSLQLEKTGEVQLLPPLRDLLEEDFVYDEEVLQYIFLQISITAELRDAAYIQAILMNSANLSKKIDYFQMGLPEIYNIAELLILNYLIQQPFIDEKDLLKFQQ